MRHDAGCVCDETLGIDPGLGGHRDGFGTEHGTSHNIQSGNQSENVAQISHANDDLKD